MAAQRVRHGFMWECEIWLIMLITRQIVNPNPIAAERADGMDPSSTVQRHPQKIRIAVPTISAKKTVKGCLNFPKAKKNIHKFQVHFNTITLHSIPLAFIADFGSSMTTTFVDSAVILRDHSTF